MEEVDKVDFLMVRFLRAGMVTVLFMCLFFAMLFPLPVQVLAASPAMVTVSTATGAAGETVGITVSLQGFSSLTGVESISGGQFELVYDSAQATVVSVKKGSLLGGDVLFMHNQNYTENSIKVTWAYTSGGMSGDGDICNITFTLLKDSTLNPALKNLVLYDQEVHPLNIDEKSTDTSGSSGNSVALYPPETDPQGTPSDSGGEQGGSVGIDQENGDTAVNQDVETAESTSGNKETSPVGSSNGGIKAGLLILSVLLPIVLVAGGVGYLFYRRSKGTASR